MQFKLVEALTDKYNDKVALVKKLTEILGIQKEAVYRRLRGDAAFSFEEAAIISEVMGISLDKLTQIEINKFRPFSLVLNDFENPSDLDYEMCESYIRLLEVFKNDKSSHAMEAWSCLPIPLIYQYPLITRYYYFKWIYQFKNYIPAKSFREIIIPDRYFELQKLTLRSMKEISYSEYILSKRLFLDVVNDIKYFYNIYLISKEELIELQKELMQFIDYLEQLSTTGIFDDTKKPIHLYVSDIKIDMNQCYIESDIYNFCMFKVLSLNSISSVDGTKNKAILNWLTNQKRLSVQISVSGEIERIRFFKTQRAYVGNLLIEE